MRSDWIRRARGSVRLRVAMLAAGLFAVTLVVAATLLLRALERSLIDDVRSADLAALQTQADTVLTNGIPADAEMVAAPGTAAVKFSSGVTAGGDVVVVGDPAILNRHLTVAGHPPSAVENGSTTSDGTDIAAFTQEAPDLLGIAGQRQDFVTSTIEYRGMVLATASPLEPVRETIAATRGLLWIIGPALVGLVVLLTWILVGRALRPVHAVTSQVAAIGSHSLHERVPVPQSRDEIAELARTMNSMLGRLEVSTSASRRLVSDASHELRTPVTVMRAELEVARDDEHADWEASSGVLLEELDRLQELIDDLLLLARGDEQARATSAVALDDLVRDAAARRRRVPVDVTLEGGPHVTVGDESAIKRALDHVLANAARHADAKVAITVAASDGDVVVHVDDDGQGIPELDRAAVVQRFVRLDEGRDRDTGGAGLGLAVTSDVLTAHGGELRIDDAPLGGARLTLTFPSAAR